MPASRNDVTRKPQYVTTTDKNKYVAYDDTGTAHVIWANTEQEAFAHAEDQGWDMWCAEQPGEDNGKTD